MKKQPTNRCARVNDQTRRMRKLYSQIGEPLPVDVIIDLCRHLDKALELAQENENVYRMRSKQACERLN